MRYAVETARLQRESDDGETDRDDERNAPASADATDPHPPSCHGVGARKSPVSDAQLRPSDEALDAEEQQHAEEASGAPSAVATDSPWFFVHAVNDSYG